MPPWRTADEIASGTARHLANALESPSEDSILLIAELDGVAMGFAWAFVLPDFYTGRLVLKISEIAVARDGSGVGSALMAACEAWGVARGCRLSVLNVLDGNTGARTFYQGRGYAPEHTMMVKSIGEESIEGGH